MLGQIEATLGGIRVVKAASAERFERQRYMRIMDRLTGEQIRMSYIDAVGAAGSGIADHADGGRGGAGGDAHGAGVAYA